MSNVAGTYGEDVPRRRPPARTSRRRTQQLVSIAQDLVEERMIGKIASPTEVVAILRLGTEYEQLNNDRIRAQTDLIHAQRAKAEAETVSDQMFKDAMDAMARYTGRE